MINYPLGWLLQKLKLPGLVRDFRHYDNGMVLEVKTSRYYTTIKTATMAFYFNRETGKYDGWSELQNERQEENDNESAP